MESDHRLVPLLRKLGADGRGLIRQEVALAGIELRTTVTIIAKQSALLLLGGILILIGLLLLIEFAVLALGRVLGNYWLSALIVGSVFAVGGIALIFWGRRALSSAQAKPNRTIETVRDTSEWVKTEAQRVKRDLAP
jgi:uncharacterized membrane protein YqjE